MSRTPPQPSETVLMRQAYESLQAGQYEEAVELFSASLAVAPRQAPALKGRGLAYGQLKRWRPAIADFEAATQVAPEDRDASVELGVALAADDQIYPAIRVFETLVQQDPSCVRGHIELGLLHLRLGAIPKGRRQLQHALSQRPTLEQRRAIEAILREQDKLDRKRLYRPDFEALHQHEQQTRSVKIGTRIRALFKRLRGKAT